MKESIWITGAKGRLGSELYKLIKDNSTEITTTDTDVDITEVNPVIDYARMNHPDIIINCAAMTNPQECEDNRVEAYRVNALGARNLAVAARTVNAKLIQLSTDDVFDGNEGEYFNEFDTPNPKSVYAKSKYAGEMMVKELAPKHIIVRSSWVYGFGENTFVDRVIRKAKNGEAIEVVKNRVGSPTSMKALAEFIKKLTLSREYGIFHASCEGECTREELAREKLKATGLNAEIKYKEGGFRPNNARIEDLMMKMTGMHVMPNWKDALHEYFGGIK